MRPAEIDISCQPARFTFALHAAYAALTRFGHDPGMRRLWLLLLCALVFAAPSAAAGKTVDHIGRLAITIEAIRP